ncbi:MAG: GNAT family N-acetyltransferase [Clostridia bacterium]|nr:GNAT family N-acetyltransferase [Clostridia bacterium]
MDIIKIDGSSAGRVVPLIAAFRVTLRGYKGIASEPDLEQAKEEIEEFLDKGYPVYAAVQGRDTAGYVVCRTDGPCVWVEHIFVREEYRRRGIASLLFKQAEDLAARLGDDTVYNFVHPNNEGMIAFLRSRGYTVLNMLEIRRPWTGETPTAKVRVNDTEFDY